MKTNNLLKVSTILAIISFNTQATNLNVTIDDINKSEGKILVQVFKGADNYKNGKAVSSLILPANKGENTFLVQNLDAGDYAIRLFHDANGNNDLDTNAFGMPTEGYGYSNEAIGNFGPAKYKDMIVTISDTDNDVSTKVKMVY